MLKYRNRRFSGGLQKLIEIPDNKSSWLGLYNLLNQLLKASNFWHAQISLKRRVSISIFINVTNLE